MKKRTQLENYLEQSNEKNRILENDIKDQKLEIDEMQISLNVKKSLIANAKNYIEVCMFFVPNPSEFFKIFS